MNDPRSSRGREGGAQRDLTAPSDLGTKPGKWKDLEEVSRGQQSLSFIHEGHERHEEKILRKMVMSRLPLPNEAMVQK